MPLTETQPNALAAVYARALFDTADARGGRPMVEDVLGQLEDILDLARADSKFGEFLCSRALGAKDRATGLERIFKGRVDDVTLNFLLTLNRKGRLHHITGITAAFDAVVQQKFGRVEVDVFSAEPLKPESVASIRTRLEAHLKKEVVIHPYVDGSMIGGIKLKIGDQFIDGSVATQLRRLQDRLQNEGLGELRAQMNRALDL